MMTQANKQVFEINVSYKDGNVLSCFKRDYTGIAKLTIKQI